MFSKTYVCSHSPDPTGHPKPNSGVWSLQTALNCIALKWKSRLCMVRFYSFGIILINIGL